MLTGAKVILGIVLIGLAILAGFGAAAIVLTVLGAVLPPFQREDDDTLREFIPVALAYAAWVGTSVVVVVLGWRRLRMR